MLNFISEHLQMPPKPLQVYPLVRQLDFGEDRQAILVIPYNLVDRFNASNDRSVIGVQLGNGFQPAIIGEEIARVVIGQLGYLGQHSIGGNLQSLVAFFAEFFDSGLNLRFFEEITG